MSARILVVDDEPDVAELFRQQFRKELRTSRFAMEFARSRPRLWSGSARRRTRGSFSSSPTSTCRG